MQGYRQPAADLGAHLRVRSATDQKWETFRRCGHEPGHRQHEQEGVEAVEHATVARQDRSHVLDAEVALDDRLAEVADRGEQGAEQAEVEGLGDAVARAVPRRARTSG